MAIAVVLFLAGSTSIASGTGVLVACKLFLVMMFGMLVPSAWFMGWQEDLSFVKAMVSLGLGVLPMGGLAIVCAKFGIEIGHAATALTVVGVALALSRPFNITNRINITPWDALYAFTCLVAFAGYIYASMEGAPALTHYPLKTGDNITHLQQGLSFLHNTGYPPKSLVNQGFLNEGHFLVQIWAVTIAQMTQAAPRTVYLMTSVYTTIFASAAVLYVILERWKISDRMRWCVPLIGWLLPMERLSEIKNVVIDLFSSNHDAFGPTISPLWVQYHAPVTMYGLFLCMVVVLTIDCFQTEKKAREQWVCLGRLSFFLFGIALAKQPQFPGMGAAVGAWSLLYWYSKRYSTTIPRFASAWPLMVSIGTAIATIWLTSSSQRGDIHLELYLGYHLRSFAPFTSPRILALMVSYAFLGVVVLDLVIKRWRTKESQRALILSLLAFPMLFPNMFIFMDYGAEIPISDYNILQASLPAFRIGWPLYVALCIERLTLSKNRLQPYAIGLFKILAICMAVLSLRAHFRVYASQKPLRTTLFRFETKLATVLSVIPYEGSLIVSNSLQRPYKTKRKLSFEEPTSIYGHAMFASNATGNSPAVDHAVALQERVLGATLWDDSILCYAKQLGWTHYLVRKEYPHSRDIPLPKLSESSLFAMYAFGTPMLQNIEMGAEGLEKRLNSAIEVCE